MGYVITATDTGRLWWRYPDYSRYYLTDGTVNGISILSISETAGLGMKAKEPKFYNQFKGKKAEKFVVSQRWWRRMNRSMQSVVQQLHHVQLQELSTLALAYYQNAF